MNQSFARISTSGPVLRVFCEDQEEPDPLPPSRSDTEATGGDLSASMSLSQFYELHVRPNCLVAKGAAPANLLEYDTAMRYWKRFTADPACNRIGAATCSQFLCELRKQPGKRKGSLMAEATLHKHCRLVQFVLDRLGPPTRELRDAAGLMAQPPYLVKPELPRCTVEKNFILAEISKMLAASRHATVPRLEGLDAAMWWMDCFAWIYNTGHRIETVLELDFSMLHVDDDKRPWLRIPPAAMKEGSAFECYLNPHAMAIFDRHKARLGSGKIFPWVFGEGYLHEVRRGIFEAAGLPESRTYGNGFHGLRKAFATELAKINGLIVPMALGHAHGNVTTGHYIHRSAMCQAMDQLPQPEWPDYDQQRRLF